jgi:ubiquinone/menaquinone biosynthesis C-methylase UbiE
MSDSQDATHYTERMVPEEAHARIFWEHVARYRFAKDFVRGQRVLDIACGEGYGAAALAKAGAATLVGIDISADVCDHARRKYGLDARVGDAQSIPLPDRSIDVVVSFETIEHVDAPVVFVRECARVLVPEGMLIVSTPNRPVYSSEGKQNPFHRLEFDEREFAQLLHSRFESVRLYSQFPRSAAWWSHRSLAAERSPWLRIRGFWRISSWICPAIRTDVSPATSASAAEIILARDSFPSSLFNPYIVRPLSRSSREQPYILVAVAKGVKNH